MKLNKIKYKTNQNKEGIAVAFWHQEDEVFGRRKGATTRHRGIRSPLQRDIKISEL